MNVRTIVKPLRPTTPKTQKKAKVTQHCENVALKLPIIFLIFRDSLGNLRATFFVREMLEGFLVPSVEVATGALQSF